MVDLCTYSLARTGFENHYSSIFDPPPPTHSLQNKHIYTHIHTYTHTHTHTLTLTHTYTHTLTLTHTHTHTHTHTNTHPNTHTHTHTHAHTHTHTHTQTLAHQHAHIHTQFWWIICCLAFVALPLAVWDFTRKGYDIRYQAWFIGGIFAILSVPISTYGVRTV